MDGHRRDQRGNPDAQTNGGGQSHYAPHRAHKRHTGGGSQSPATEGQHARHQEGNNPKHK